jgi:hypothetical protein
MDMSIVMNHNPSVCVHGIYINRGTVRCRCRFSAPETAHEGKKEKSRFKYEMRYLRRAHCNMTSPLSKHAHMCPLRKVNAVHSLPGVTDCINTKRLALGQQTEHFSARLVSARQFQLNDAVRMPR